MAPARGVRLPDGDRPPRSDRRRDAALVVGLLAVLFGAGTLADASLHPVAALVGAVGTVLLELLAHRREHRVRQLWGRIEVRVVITSLALIAVLVGTWIEPSLAVSVGVGAGIAYLLLLGIVAVLDR